MRSRWSCGVADSLLAAVVAVGQDCLRRSALASWQWSGAPRRGTDGGVANRPSRRATTNPEKGLRLARESVAHLLPTDTCKTDPDLAAVVDAWPDLPEALKVGIVAMIRAARTRGPESPAGAGQRAE